MLDQNVYTFLTSKHQKDVYTLLNSLSSQTIIIYRSAPMTSFNPHQLASRLVLSVFRPTPTTPCYFWNKSQMHVSSVKIITRVPKIYHNFRKDFHALKKLTMLPYYSQCSNYFINVNLSYQDLNNVHKLQLMVVS